MKVKCCECCEANCVATVTLPSVQNTFSYRYNKVYPIVSINGTMEGTYRCIYPISYFHRVKFSLCFLDSLPAGRAEKRLV